MTELEMDTGVKNDQAKQIFESQTAFLISFQKRLLPSSFSSKTSQKSQAGNQDWRVLVIKIFLKTVWLLPFGAVVGKIIRKAGVVTYSITKCNILKKKKNPLFIFHCPVHRLLLLWPGLALYYATNWRTKWHRVTDVGSTKIRTLSFIL